MAQPVGGHDRRVRGRGRPLARRARRFRLLVFYLSDYDYASHAHGPDTAIEELRRCDDAIGALAETAGGLDALLERYAVIVMSDHGQTRVHEASRSPRRYAGVDGVLPLGSNRAAHVYLRPGCRLDARDVAARLDGAPAAEIVLFREGDAAVARREGEELRFAPAAGGGFALTGDATIIEPPGCAHARVGGARQPERRRGARLGGAGARVRRSRRRPPRRRRVARVAHAGDSEVPFLTVGLDGAAASIVDVAPLVLSHFGVAAPTMPFGPQPPDRRKRSRYPPPT